MKKGDLFAIKKGELFIIMGNYKCVAINFVSDPRLEDISGRVRVGSRWFIGFNDKLIYERTPVHLSVLQFHKVIGWA